MRLVSAPLGVGDAALPSSSKLEELRHLATRFPQARLRETAVVRAEELDLCADPAGYTRVWLALESLQVTGSFKVRGALAALAPHAGSGAHVVTAADGNHGIAIAYAARVFGLAATVVVSQGLSRAKRQKIEAFGGEVVVTDVGGRQEASCMARQLAAASHGLFVCPHDDVDTVLGNGASLGYEIVRNLGGVPDVVLAPFGGGGLATGLACALAAEAGESLAEVRRVWGIQSSAAPVMAMSLERGAAVECFTPRIVSMADGLETGISRASFARARGAIAGVCVVDELDIAAAMAFACREMHLVLEGSAALSLVALLSALPPRLCGGDVLAVLTGRNVDRDRFEEAMVPAASTTRLTVVTADDL